MRSTGSYNYCKTHYEAYSWGSGYNYVLATGEEDTEYTPHEVPEAFLRNW